MYILDITHRMKVWIHILFQYVFPFTILIIHGTFVPKL